ncbi:flagellar biosynthesis anti-sigma factor FlgM [Marinobacter salicampi]|uniref:flagellar biosynthesis anti-sigma factor FlgM n=1 Tax=Marinobacter salicampi TaxID=435907 RepID=UPI00140A62BD|nr:flagellar biosynthesis anti-sigma factor FlgM [Marinobacter salicampi]
MTVDFNGVGRGQVNTQKTVTDKPQTSQPQQPAAEQAQAPKTQGENVSLSAQAKDLKQIEQQLASYPEVDDARVEEIKAALADGSYKVDAEKLAQKMLDMDNSIFG